MYNYVRIYTSIINCPVPLTTPYPIQLVVNSFFKNVDKGRQAIKLCLSQYPLFRKVGINDDLPRTEEIENRREIPRVPVYQVRTLFILQGCKGQSGFKGNT